MLIDDSTGGAGPALPESYGEDQIEVLVRGPQSILLQWSLDGEKGRKARSLLAGQGTSWMVRLRKVDSDESFDIPVDSDARKLYVTVLAGYSYEASVGYQEGDLYHAIADSGKSPSMRFWPKSKNDVPGPGAVRVDPGSRKRVPTSPGGLPDNVSRWISSPGRFPRPTSLHSTSPGRRRR